MRTCRWYAFALTYENVGIVVIRLAGEEVSISVARGVCLTLVLGLWVMRERAQRRKERPRAPT